VGVLVTHLVTGSPCPFALAKLVDNVAGSLAEVRVTMIVSEHPYVVGPAVEHTLELHPVEALALQGAAAVEAAVAGW
jgi:hypothetical protein